MTILSSRWPKVLSTSATPCALVAKSIVGSMNQHETSIFLAPRNATATTDLIVKQLLCSSAVSDFFSTFYASNPTTYAEYLCEAWLRGALFPSKIFFGGSVVHDIGTAC